MGNEENSQTIGFFHKTYGYKKNIQNTCKNLKPVHGSSSKKGYFLVVFHKLRGVKRRRKKSKSIHAITRLKKEVFLPEIYI